MFKKFIIGFFVPIALAFALPAFSKQPQRINLIEFIEKVSVLTSKQYIFAEEPKGTFFLTKNLKINKNNAGKFLSSALNLNGFTRIPMGNNNYKIVKSRNVRYQALFAYNANDGSLPDTDDYISVIYKLKEPRRISDFTRQLRPLLSRFARIIQFNSEGKLLLCDTATNAKRILRLMESMDTPLTNKDLKKRENRRRRNQKLKSLDVEMMKVEISKLNKKVEELSSRIERPKKKTGNGT